MPTYEYRCNACEHEFEQFQSIKASPIKKCPACGRQKVERLISGGGAVLFKGSGFYETDYRSSSYQKAAEAEKKAAEPKPDGKPDGKSDSKSEGGSDGAASSKPEKTTDARKPSATPKQKPTGKKATSDSA